MSSLRNILTDLLSGLGIGRLSRAMWGPKARFVLAFHGVCSRRYADIPRNVQPSMSVGELRAVLGWLQDRFAVLSPDRFFNTDEGGVLLTFDDGLASNHENALPLLTEFNAPAIFFVSTQHVLNPKNWLPGCCEFAARHWHAVEDVPDSIAADFYDGMTEAQLRACADNPLITIGGHTISHPSLPRCAPAALEREVVESKVWLEDVTGQPIDLFAYPYGDYNRAVAEAVRAANYRAAFVVDPLPVGMPDYEIPRIGIYWSEAAYLDVKLSGLYRWPVRP